MPSGRRLAVYGGAMALGLAILGAWLANNMGSGDSTAARSSGLPSTAAATSMAANTGAVEAPKTPASVATTDPSGSIATPVISDDTRVATITPEGAPGSAMPDGPPTKRVPGEWLGAASILPVIAQQAGWVEVRLAQRPNESVAWVPAEYVSLATDSYHIVVNLDTMHLQLFNRGVEVASFPAGIGVPGDPTPTGHFFVALFAQSPSPGYGAFVIVTSAHSNSISDWEESGDAITAIHGSLGADAAIGTTGAQVSHGCIRLHDGDLLQLRDVPAGTPVDILG